MPSVHDVRTLRTDICFRSDPAAKVEVGHCYILLDDSFFCLTSSGCHEWLDKKGIATEH